MEANVTPSVGGKSFGAPTGGSNSTRQYRIVSPNTDGFPTVSVYDFRHMTAPPTSPSDRNKSSDLDPRVARSRARVLDAATHLLVEGGPSALTVDAIAARSSVAKSTLYRHWSSIDDLVVDVLGHNLQTTHVPDGVEGFEPSMRALMHEIAARGADPEWQKILPALFTLKLHTSAIETMADDDQNEQLSVLSNVLDLGVAEGRLPADIEPEFALYQLIGPIVLATLASGGDTPLTMVDALVDHFLAGWAQR